MATYKKYGPRRGELMLIHLCGECAQLSINRIAADDDPQTALTVFEDSFRLEDKTHARLRADGRCILDQVDMDTVCVQLFGRKPDLADMFFKCGVFELV